MEGCNNITNSTSQPERQAGTTLSHQQTMIMNKAAHFMDKRSKSIDFDCFIAWFIDLQRINVTTKYPPLWRLAIR